LRFFEFFSHTPTHALPLQATTDVQYHRKWQKEWCEDGVRWFWITQQFLAPDVFGRQLALSVRLYDASPKGDRQAHAEGDEVKLRLTGKAAGEEVPRVVARAAV
jgi:hypothetical protein